jgi:rfaE bifunctional protein kinase chain/domain
MTATQKLPPEVLVIGDIMLDRYTRVSIKSSAVESNSLIVHEESTEECLGGAANVAANLTGLGRRVKLLGMRGRDRTGEDLCCLLVQDQIDCSGVWRVTDHKTTVRHRIVSPHGQLLRVDAGEYRPARTASVGNSVVLFEETFMRVLDECAPPTPGLGPVIVVSDYSMGFCDPSVLWTPLLRAARRGCPILVDPPRDGVWNTYAFNTTLFKPNVRQALNFLKALYSATDFNLKYGLLSKALAAVTSSLDAAYPDLFYAVRTEMLDHAMPFAYLWLTLGRDGGLLGADNNETPLRVPRHERAGADPTGAGDTALAVLASRVVDGYDLDNVRAGVCVAHAGAALAASHPGTYRVTSEALGTAISNKLG